MSSVKVAVRVRPFNNREMSKECGCIIGMEGKTTRKYNCCMLFENNPFIHHFQISSEKLNNLFSFVMKEIQKRILRDNIDCILDIMHDKIYTRYTVHFIIKYSVMAYEG